MTGDKSSELSTFGEYKAYCKELCELENQKGCCAIENDLNLFICYWLENSQTIPRTLQGENAIGFMDLTVVAIFLNNI